MAYISIEEVNEIRTQLKKALGKKWKLSVTGGNSCEISIRVVSGPIAMPKDYIQVRHFRIDETFKKHGRTDLIKTFNTIKEIAMKNHWDKSKIEIDRHICSFFVNIEVGHWDTPYINTNATNVA